MTGFDIIVLIIIGVGAVGGFLRGFVQEVLSLSAWILALFAIHYLHTPLTDWLSANVGELPGSALTAFALLLLIPYAGMKLIAGRLGESSRNSILGPIDRVLGFGFGAVKGGIVAVMAFSLLVLGYDSIWGIAGRPPWIVNARTYPAINAGSDALVQMIDSRHEERETSDADVAGHDGKPD
ncbi:MAG: CvpA family protein [Novosphingobium sp.]|nr:CvpA family protein [Novosphingobium sp.]